MVARHATLKMAQAALQNPDNVVSEVAKRLNLTTTTLCTYLNGDGSLKEAGVRVMERSF
jgi:hypothetical protein